jgi:hypothetical protein
MKKIIKKAQTGTQVARSIKISRPETVSDSARAVQQSNYNNLRAMAKRGSTAAKESAPNAKATQAEYKAARKVQKNGGKMSKCKHGCK